MVRHFFLTLYDHLGRVVLYNLLWAVTVMPWIAVGSAVTWGAASIAGTLGYSFLVTLGFLAAAGLILFSLPTMFVVAATYDWARGGQGGLREAWVLTRRLAWRAQAGGLLMTTVITLLLGNALFYQSWAGWLGLALSGTMLWLAVAATLMALLLFPVLVDNPEVSMHQALRQCAFLVLGNVRHAAVLGLAAGLCLIIGLASGAGLVLGAVSALALVTNLGLMAIMQRHGGRSLERDPRSLRDLLRPWQA